jgi:hypothetical protein
MFPLANEFSWPFHLLAVFVPIGLGIRHAKASKGELIQATANVALFYAYMAKQIFKKSSYKCHFSLVTGLTIKLIIFQSGS